MRKPVPHVCSAVRRARFAGKLTFQELRAHEGFTYHELDSGDDDGAAPSFLGVEA